MNQSPQMTPRLDAEKVCPAWSEEGNVWAGQIFHGNVLYVDHSFPKTKNHTHGKSKLKGGKHEDLERSIRGTQDQWINAQSTHACPVFPVKRLWLQVWSSHSKLFNSKGFGVGSHPDSCLTLAVFPSSLLLTERKRHSVKVVS